MRNSPDPKIVLLAAMQAVVSGCGSVKVLAAVEGAAQEVADKL